MGKFHLNFHVHSSLPTPRFLADTVLTVTFFSGMSRKTWSSTAIECLPTQTSPENHKISAASEGNDETYT